MMYSETLVGVMSKAGVTDTDVVPFVPRARCCPSPGPRMIIVRAVRPPPIHWLIFHVLEASASLVLTEPLDALPRSPLIASVGAVPSARLSMTYIARSNSKKCHFLGIGAAAERKKNPPKLERELRAELGCHVPEL